MVNASGSVKSRKSHKKSRKGCAGCKRRHVKCGEEKPSCEKCVLADIRCSFLDTRASHSRAPTASFGSPVTRNHIATAPSLTPAPSAASDIANSGHLISEYSSQGILNMVHLDLLRNFLQKGTIWSAMGLCNEEESSVTAEILRLGLENPYLMHELLSFSATHMSTVESERAEFFKYQATELQTAALSLSKDAMNGPQSADSLASFLFSATLGNHYLHDAISMDSEDFGAFLDNFVQYLRVARGVSTQINGPRWQALAESPLRGIYKAASGIPNHETASAPELDGIENLLQIADISPSSLNIYKEALKYLKSAFQAHGASKPDNRGTAISAISTFPIRVSPEYTDLLAQRRPEALAILAHFGVLIHLYRDIWIFHHGGRGLIEAIRKYLGAYWEPWLELPNRVLQES